MAFNLRTWHTPKNGNTSQEFEDAFAWDFSTGRFAISDGASESAFADVWAKILVNQFIQNANSGLVEKARENWETQIRDRELPWYAETKFQEGAFATFLGLEFYKKHWRASGIGDCCLFQIRDNELKKAFPLRHASDFNNRPSLLCSRNHLKTKLNLGFQQIEGDWKSEDVFFLATDALAEWFLFKINHGQSPQEDLLKLSEEGNFLDLIATLRTNKAIKNDDVTSMIIQIP